MENNKNKGVIIILVSIIIILAAVVAILAINLTSKKEEPVDNTATVEDILDIINNNKDNDSNTSNTTDNTSNNNSSEATKPENTTSNNTENKVTFKDSYTKAGFTDNNISQEVEKTIRNVLSIILANWQNSWAGGGCSQPNGSCFAEGVTLETYVQASYKNYLESIRDNTIKYSLDNDNHLNVRVRLEYPVDKGFKDVDLVLMSFEESCKKVNSNGKEYLDAFIYDKIKEEVNAYAANLSPENYPEGTSVETLINNSKNNYINSVNDNTIKYYILNGKLNLIVRIETLSGKGYQDVKIVLD